MLRIRVVCLTRGRVCDFVRDANVNSFKQDVTIRSILECATTYLLNECVSEGMEMRHR